MAKMAREQVPLEMPELKLLDELEQGLRIDEYALEEALQQQPDLYWRVSKQLAILTSRRDGMKQEVEVTEAEADLDIRKRRQDKEKLTEGEVKARIRLSPTVIEVKNSLLELGYLVGQYTALKEAYQQRSYVLKDLCNLYTANYYGTSGEADSRLRDHSAQFVREGRRSMRRAG